jgi:hypothetical protein
MRARLAALVLALLSVPVAAQQVSTEYRVKATYLFNFVKFVEWPEKTQQPLLLCVAGRNPFGPVLEETVAGESVNGRPLQVEVILEPDSRCDLVFVPRGAATSAYLLAARNTPTLTVGEEPDFVARGGIVSFYIDGANVRFTINPYAAERAKLRISSRLLELARIVDDRGETR